MRNSLLQAVVAAAPNSLRWQLAPSLAAAAAAVLGTRGVKTTTGIVGLPVDERARVHLKRKLDDVLEAIKVIPVDAEYR